MEIELGHLPENVLVLLVAEERHSGVLIAPDSVHDGERDQHARRYHRIDLAELAGGYSLPNDSTQQLRPAGYDFVSVELGQIGKLVELTEDETVDRAEDRRADELPVGPHCGAELLCRRSLPDCFLAPLDCGDGGLPDHLAKELFLVGEVEVDGALGDSGAIGDVLESGVGEAAFAEDLESGLDDLLGPVLGSSSPFWLCGLGSWSD